MGEARFKSCWQSKKGGRGGGVKMVNGTITVYRWLNEKGTGAKPVWMVQLKRADKRHQFLFFCFFCGKTISCFSDASISTLAIKESCIKALVMMTIWRLNWASVKINS